MPLGVAAANHDMLGAPNGSENSRSPTPSESSFLQALQDDRQPTAEEEEEAAMHRSASRQGEEDAEMPRAAAPTLNALGAGSSSDWQQAQSMPFGSGMELNRAMAMSIEQHMQSRSQVGLSVPQSDVGSNAPRPPVRPAGGGRVSGFDPSTCVLPPAERMKTRFNPQTGQHEATGETEFVPQLPQPIFPSNATSNGVWEPLQRDENPLAGGQLRDGGRFVRWLVFNVPLFMVHRNAESLRDLQLVEGNTERCFATAALLSLFFAPLEAGFPSGAHEEVTRAAAEAVAADGNESGAGAKEKRKAIGSVKTYRWVPPTDDQDSWPMFQIGIEHLLDENQADVLAIRVHLWIYDSTHSTSDLMKKQIDVNASLERAKRASAYTGSARDKAACAEADKRVASGCDNPLLDKKFDSLVHLQHQRIVGTHSLELMLQLHAGGTSRSKGRPFVEDQVAHFQGAVARRGLVGDNTGCGGTSLHSPEVWANGKHKGSLAAGLIGPDGEELKIYKPQLEPSSYHDAENNIRLPRDLKHDVLWVNKWTDKNSPLSLPLPRALQGTVQPGEHMVKLFLEHVAYKANVAAGTPDVPIRASQLRVSANTVNELRSLMTGRDEYQRSMRGLLSSSTTGGHDFMSKSGSVAGGIANEVDENFVKRDRQAHETVQAESNRFYTSVVEPWMGREKHRIAMYEEKLCTHEEKRAALMAAIVIDGETVESLRRERDASFLHARRSPSAMDTGELHRAVDVIEREIQDIQRQLLAQETEVKRMDASMQRQNCSRADFLQQKTSMDKRFYDVKKDCAQYHLSLLASCFESTREALTMPTGFKAMKAAIDRGVESRDGTASMANYGDGHALNTSDRMTWGGLQEWLRTIFVDDCKIDGRDRRIMARRFPGPLAGTRISTLRVHRTKSTLRALSPMPSTPSSSSSLRKRAVASPFDSSGWPASFRQAGRRTTRQARHVLA